MSEHQVFDQPFRPARRHVLAVSVLVLGLAGFCVPEEAQAMPLQRFPAVNAGNVLSQADAQTTTGGNLHCEIRGRLESGLLNLQAIVLADDAFTGSYSFNLINRGSSGSSSTSQRGIFTLTPNEEKVVGLITVYVSQGHTYYSQLQVAADDSDVLCDFTFE